MSSLKGRVAIGIGGVLAAATILMLDQLHIVREPAWLGRMNEFEHLVFHLALTMTGLIIGISGLATFVWAVLRLREPHYRRRAMPRALGGNDGARLRPGHLVGIGAAALVVVTAFTIKRHLIEPLWLTDVTPFQHLLLHLGLGIGGLVLGLSGLGAFLLSSLKLVDPLGLLDDQKGAHERAAVAESRRTAEPSAHSFSK